MESLLMSKEHEGIFRSITDYFEFFQNKECIDKVRNSTRCMTSTIKINTRFQKNKTAEKPHLLRRFTLI